ncbi:caspase family protein [Yoonia sediminilitoris]|uniref:Uncharacterized protein DUF1311 n=1 Tax=Yoonia sediminilitoris TaxID=1286148 RepID=A0A2T6K5D6_9RHOB|nr:caspase family protein [Yoonia sediminilitoris]PUB09869.1 uncharacterized protein DUF1311 [Yoonia sediminilitoris]RCW89592.1 uncharacterized protein DUF1311 [Yoonia sediminilitoris]
MLSFRILVALFLLALPGLAAAKSLALIIGNDTYDNVPSLQKARADASGYQDVLQGLGFDVTMRTDLNGRDMGFELATFLDRIAPGDTVAFVFSGHGWSDGRENFLVPTDIRVGGSETLIARESFALRNGVNGIIDEIAKRGAGLTLAIVDACRDNPFATDQGTRSVGLARGLAPIDAPTGTFVAFSAGAGQTALDRLSDDDPAPYSVFTRHFLTELAKPQDLQSAFKRTQRLVNEEAGRIGHPQRPAYYDEVIGAACLSGLCDGATIVAQPKPAPDRNAAAARDWEAFRNSNSIDALRLFQQQYTDTAYAALANERIAQLQVPEAKPQPTTTTPVTRQQARPGWCPNARTRTERAICANDTLSALDIALEAAFKAKRATLNGAARDALLTQQRAWLRDRDSCGDSVSCMQTTYALRLDQLRN